VHAEDDKVKLTSNLFGITFAQTSVGQVLLCIIYKWRSNNTQEASDLAFLQSQNAILYCIRDDKTMNIDIAQLSKAMNTIEGLGFYCLTPAKIKRDNA